MNKQKLIELGIDEETADKAMETHNNAIDGNYVTKTRFNEVNEENKKLKTQVIERDNQIDELSKVDADDLQKTITRLKKENEDKSNQYQKELKDLKVKHSAERQISDYKARDLTSVLAHVDLSEASLNDDGTVQGLKDKLDTLKEEKSFLFDEDKSEEDEKSSKRKFKGAQPGNPKGNDPSGEPDVTKMSYSEFEEYLENQK